MTKTMAWKIEGEERSSCSEHPVNCLDMIDNMQGTSKELSDAAFHKHVKNHLAMQVKKLTRSVH